MDEKDKIQIILEEYKTLRAEIMQRHIAATQVFTVSGIAFVTIVGLALANDSIFIGILLCLIVLFLVLVAALMHDNDVRIVASKLREIEAEVNRRAADKLLDWETSRGLLAVGYAERAKRIWRKLCRRTSHRSGEGADERI